MLLDILLAAPQADPNAPIKIALISVGGVALTALLTYLSARYTARKSGKAAEAQVKITERQVDVSEWQALLAEIKGQASRLAERVETLETKDEQRVARIEELEDRVKDAETRADLSEGKYRVAVRHLKELLLWAVDPNRSDVPPVTPEELLEDLK